MTSCEHTRADLSAYLDGELGDARISVVRGHLRECAACRAVARDEAALRDGLRALEPVDPPAAMWAGIQAKLAAEEVADAKQPSWRRAVARWSAGFRNLARPIALGGIVAAAAVVVAVWHHRSAEDAPVIAAVPAPVAAPADVEKDVDVAVDLTHDDARRSASYGGAITELTALAAEARPSWSDEQRTAFDARVAVLRADLAKAPDKHKAERALVRYLRNAVVRDDVAYASGGVR
ncbi:MAG TPA: zf-HC2 domain-containing protein [Kofleriaceae bacterium]